MAASFPVSFCTDYGNFTISLWNRFVLHLLTNPLICTWVARSYIADGWQQKAPAPVDATEGSPTVLCFHVGKLLWRESVGFLAVPSCSQTSVSTMQSSICSHSLQCNVICCSVVTISINNSHQSTGTGTWCTLYSVHAKLWVWEHSPNYYWPSNITFLWSAVGINGNKFDLFFPYISRYLLWQAPLCMQSLTLFHCT